MKGGKKEGFKFLQQNTHRHHYLFALAEQHGVLQHVIRDGAKDALSRRHGSQVKVKQPLQLVQRQHKMLPESLCHKLLQLWGQHAGGAPPVREIKTRRGGTAVTINRTVGDGGGGGVHRLVLPDRLTVGRSAASSTSDIQVPLQRRLVFFCSLLSHPQTLLPADVDGL